MANRLKVYTKEYGLMVSRPYLSESDKVYLLQKLSVYCTITKVYSTNGKQSQVVEFTLLKTKDKRPIYYTRSDNVKVYTLSIHPENYPMTAFYSDGSCELI